MKKNILGVLFFLICLFIFTVSSIKAVGINTVVVTTNDLATSLADVIAKPESWFFYNDETDVIDGSLGSFLIGPGTPPLGVGSAQISVTGSQRRNLATYQFAGQKLADITVLKFTTYNPSAGNGGSTNRSGYLNFNVDFTGSSSLFQRRLVYVPSANGVVSQNSWNEWDAINGGNAIWTWSGLASNGNVWPDGNPNANRTWSDIVTSFPNARINTPDSWLGIRVGEPYLDGYTENIDSFKFGTSGGITVFNFEPVFGPPTLFSECSGTNWKTFNNPTFSKKSQCEKYVKDHQKTIRGQNVRYTAYGLKREVDMKMTTGENAGYFEYDDSAKAWYNVKVSSVKVDGDNGWFAGRVTKASNPSWVGLWLFAKVNDGTPDKIWGSFTDESTALNGVASMGTPIDGPFDITKKDIKIN